MKKICFVLLTISCFATTAYTAHAAQPAASPSQGMDIYSAPAPVAPSGISQGDTSTVLGPPPAQGVAPISGASASTGVPASSGSSGSSGASGMQQANPIQFPQEGAAPLSSPNQGSAPAFGSQTTLGTPHTGATHSTSTTLGPAVRAKVAPFPADAISPHVQERLLPPSPLPASVVKPQGLPDAPAQPTAEQIAEQQRQEALRKAEEAKKQQEEALAREVARKEQQYKDAALAYGQQKYEDALVLWDGLAKEGHTPSMTALGLIHDRGEGVPIDTKKAMTWFRKAADLGDVNGMYHLGRLLVLGRGGAQHFDTAATWLRRAAEKSQHEAQYLLGFLYENGKGVLQNDAEAAAWYSLAAAGQNVSALARLGSLYRMGKGVPKNEQRAALLLYGATMDGSKEAQKELFDMSQEAYGEKGFPKITLFGIDLATEQGISRATMRSALSVSQVKPLREDTTFICDIYDLKGVVPGAHEMSVCYGSAPQSAEDSKQNPLAHQKIGFLKIDYAAPSDKTANAVQKMVEQRYDKPTASEAGHGYMWNLGHVIVATKYMADKKEVGLMYLIPSVYYSTRQSPQP